MADSLGAAPAARLLRLDGCREAARVEVGDRALLYIVPITGAAVDVSAAGPVDAVVPVASLPRTREGAVDAAALLAVPVLDEAARARAEAALGAVVPGAAVLLADAPRALPHTHPSRWVTLPRPAPARPTTAAATPAYAASHDAAGPRALSEGGPAPIGPATLPEVLARAASRGGETTYIDERGATAVPHAALLEEASRVAGALLARGVGRGDAVLIAVGDARAILTAFWGAVLAGAVPAIVSVPPTLAERTAALDALVRAHEALDAPLVVGDRALLDALPSGARVGALTELLEGPRALLPAPARPDDVALYSLSSGSTGRPKVIELTHRGLLARARGAHVALRGGDAERALSWLPFDHIGSISDWHLRPLDAGSALFYAPKELILAAPLRWLDLLELHRITASWAPNFAYGLVVSALAREGGGRRWDLSRVECLLTAGESVSRQTVSEVAQALGPFGLAPHAVVPAFGMAELGSGVTYAPPSRGHLAAFFEHDGAQFADLGPPIAGAKLRVVDADGRVLPERAVGQVQIGGEVVARGYRRASPEQAAAFLPDGWLDTGDRGFLAGGHLVLTGRSKDVIIVNGANYYAHDVEAVVEGVAGVEPSFTAALAVSAPDERLAIVYASALPPDARAAQVRAIRRAVVARAGISPELVVPVPKASIPKTAIGKIMRARLREQLGAGQFDAAIAEVEAALGGPSAVPDWFLVPTWVRAEPVPDDPRAGAQALVTGGDDVAEALAREVARELAALAVEARVVRTVDEAGSAAVVSLASAGSATLSSLIEAGLGRVGRAAEFTVITRDPTASPRPAAVAAWTRARIAERGGRLVVLGEGATPRAIAEELARRGDPEVRLSSAGRALRRWRRLTWPDAPSAAPIARDALYVVTGGSGGLGAPLARELIERWGARVLVVSRSGGHAGAAMAARVDVRDADALEAAVREAERAHGPLAGVFHLAGVYREALVEQETAASLAEVRGPKAEGARAVAALLASRPAALFVGFSSLAGSLGAAGLGAYGAANAEVDALAEALRAEGRAAWSIAWSAFSDVGMGQAAAASEVLRARGFLPVSPARGLSSAWALMTRAEPVIAAGLDPTHPELRARCLSDALATRALRAFATRAPDAPVIVDDARGRAITLAVEVVSEVPRLADGRADADALLGRDGHARSAPASDTERTLAALWRELLSVPEVWREDDFFALGGHSLLATQLASRVRERLWVTLPVGKLFEATTLSAMAALVDELTGPASGEVDALLEQVRDLSAEQLAALLAHDAAPAPSTAITTLGVLTSNRPAALERALRSYLDNLREHGRRLEVVVTDDSRDEATARDNEARLAAIAREYGADARYAWVADKVQFMDRLVARTGAPRHVVQSSIVRGTSGVFACGVNRNSFQLATVGEVPFLADDDTVCRVVLPPAPREGVGLTARADGAELWFFGDREAALADHAPVRADVIGLHEAWLGTSAGAHAAVADAPLPPGAAARLTHADTRVRMTVAGLLGDTGWAVPFGQWGAPMGYLLLDAASRARLVEREAHYRRAITSRQILRVVARPTLSDETYSMSTFCAFDNREYLAPYLASMRGADLVFGATLWRLDPRLAFAHLPHALLHAPMERREFHVGELVRTATSFDATRMFINLVRAWPEPSVLDPRERSRGLGRWMIALAAQPPADFWRAIAEQSRPAEEALLAAIDAELARYGRAPRWWADDLTRYAETLRRSIARDGWFRPVDVRALANGDEAAERLGQQMVRELGEMLLWWPDLVAAAGELRREGVRLVRAPR